MKSIALALALAVGLALLPEAASAGGPGAPRRFSIGPGHGFKHHGAFEHRQHFGFRRPGLHSGFPHPGFRSKPFASPRWVWVPGGWYWNGFQWLWVPGHWRAW